LAYSIAPRYRLSAVGIHGIAHTGEAVVPHCTGQMQGRRDGHARAVCISSRARRRSQTPSRRESRDEHIPRQLCDRPFVRASAGAAPNPLAENGDSFGLDTAAVGAGAATLAKSSPSQLGRAFGPLSVTTPFGYNVTPTNATSLQFGEQASEFFQTATPYATGAVIIGGVVAVGTAAVSGYQNGGGPAGRRRLAHMPLRMSGWMRLSYGHSIR